MKTIRRTFAFPLEVRAAENDKPVIAGYAAVFDTLSLDLGGFREKIAPGAFTKTLADASNDVVALWSHDWSMPLGRRSAGTLNLTEDDKGLAVEIVPDETSWSQDALSAVRSGNVRGMSFGFFVESDTWDRNAKIRTLNEVSLYEVSLTTYPAYPATEASVRSALAELEQSFNAGSKAITLAARQYELLRLRSPR